MNNYYKFNNLSTNVFNGTDYDEFYYSCKFLIEELSNIKIIVNILKERDRNE